MMEKELNRGSHVVYDIHLHICFVTQYRKKVLTTNMIKDMREIIEKVLTAKRCSLEEFEGEPDHVHILIQLHPDNNISQLISSLKSATSRIIRRKYAQEINQFYWGKAKLWHDSKCIVSCGGAPLEIVKDYIKNQSGGRQTS
ncbi:MAG: IS200/IS605 family transposase [Okeania sp. SIO1H4]|uniref:IS200/IS605 family transposase n=2 Tax=Microcoleaceae TaxID=1892252 RepID=A0A3N6QJ68_9CYAN|nr:IS200/IS605 family transposase [Okeania sp. SIO1H4]NES92972.1 IS200/IS605 family transposase [Okeania sp. SIO2B9]NET23815.1 IS200/IS605 family transposase [Okeania sp. SIO1H5]NET80408.1 IS200/IS605 family transposase [Okeania sp. SIO1F9]NET97585.1 IS200/IS605 family transposase [Okeania sp. SIO1H2]RQH13329.1 IS200/IS605 family transposase [Okeania hirsuta]